MRNFFTLCGLASLLLICQLQAFGQAPGWQWARTASGGNSDYGRALAVDAQGNLFVAGTYLSANFTLEGNPLPNSSSTHQVFLAKYNPSGTLQWVRNAGGAGINLAYGVATDAQGNAIVVGTSGSIAMQFGSITASLSGTNAGALDLFVAKYSPTGTPLWARRAGGISDEQANAVATDAAGNVYVAGDFASRTLSFAGSGLTVTKFNTGPALDAFLLKYDAAGTLQWARGVGAADDEKAHAVAADAAGNVTLTGYFVSPSVSVGSTTLTNPGVARQGFVARYNSAGTAQWARAIGGSVRAEATAVALDPQGNAHVSGFFNGGTVGFGGSVGSLTPAGSGAADCFVAKYSAAGAPQWARQAGGVSGESSNCVAIDAAGDVYMGAVVSSVFITFAGVTQQTGGSADMAVFKFSAQGNPLWVRYGGNPFANYASGLEVGPSGQVYLAGAYEAPTATFGSTRLTNTNTAPVRTSDYILLSLASTVTASRMAQTAAPLRLFPNPSTGSVTLQLPTTSPAPWQLRIYDAQGRLLRRAAPTASGVVDLSAFPPGIYAVQAEQATQVLTARITLQ